MLMWQAIAKYDDGTNICKLFPYIEDGNTQLESDRQYQLEAWLIEREKTVIWYSVDIVNV